MNPKVQKSDLNCGKPRILKLKRHQATLNMEVKLGQSQDYLCMKQASIHASSCVTKEQLFPKTGNKTSGSK